MYVELGLVSVPITISSLDLFVRHWVKWISYLFHLADIISSEANETIMQISSSSPSPPFTEMPCRRRELENRYHATLGMGNQVLNQICYSCPRFFFFLSNGNGKGGNCVALLNRKQKPRTADMF